MSNELNPVPRKKTGRFARLDLKVKNSLINGGAALLQIKEQKLYVGWYETFELYCTEELGISESRGFQLCDAAKVLEKLKLDNCITLPDKEAQTRELKKAPEDKQKEAWEKAQKSATEEGREKPTAADVKKAVEKVAPKKPIIVNIEATNVTATVAAPVASEPPPEPPAAESPPAPIHPYDLGDCRIHLMSLNALEQFNPVPGIETCIWMKEWWNAIFERLMIVRDAKYYLVPMGKENKNLEWIAAPTFNEWLAVNGFGITMHEPSQSTTPPLPTPPTPVSAPKKPLADPFAAAKQDCAKGDAALKVIGEFLDWIEERQSPYTAGEALQRGSKEVIEKFKQTLAKHKIV